MRVGWRTQAQLPSGAGLLLCLKSVRKKVRCVESEGVQWEGLGLPEGEGGGAAAGTGTEQGHCIDVHHATRPVNHACC